MGDTIKLKKGLKVNLPTLQLAEPALVTDEQRLYIGGVSGNIGIPNMTDIDLINTSLAGLLYRAPIINLTGTPTSATYKYGQTVGSTTLSLAITKQTNNITQINYKRNGTVIHTNNTPNNVSDVYTDNTPVIDTATFLTTVLDGNTTTTSNSIVLTFVYQIFAGGITKTITTPVSADVKALTEVLKAKQNITQPFTLTDQKGVFAYPTSYGNLTSILDVNGFEIISSFTETVLILTMDDNSTISYNVYTMTNSVTVSAYNITFKF